MSTIENSNPRYVVVGTDVHDRETGRVAKFQNAGVAQIGADWLNGPDATPDDYEWTSADDMTSDEWLAIHPEVTAAAPAWVDTIDADSDTEGAVSISFDRDFGAVEIGSAATWRDGTVTQRDPGAYVYFSENEALVTAADLRRYAADFTAAADALELAK